MHMKIEPAFYEEKHSHEMYIYLVLCSTFILPQRIIIFYTIFVLKQEITAQGINLCAVSSGLSYTKTYTKPFFHLLLLGVI